MDELSDGALHHLIVLHYSDPTTAIATTTSTAAAALSSKYLVWSGLAKMKFVGCS